MGCNDDKTDYSSNSTRSISRTCPEIHWADWFNSAVSRDIIPVGI